MNIDYLEVILKISERCNINCTYCYYFNGTNGDYKGKPIFFGEETLLSVVGFLNNSIRQYGIKTLQIDLHGGEPLLLKKDNFITLMSVLRGEIDPLVDMRVALQTNAMLIDQGWIELFSKFKISVSVSLDGCEKDNDLYRVDKKNEGTYRSAVNGLKLLQNAQASQSILPGGVICVANGSFDGAATYRHFVNELNVNRIHFLLPDHHFDNPPPGGNDQLLMFFSGALDEWLADGINKIHVRIFDVALGNILSGFDLATEERVAYKALTIRSDGAINPPDELRNVIPALFNDGYNTHCNSLSDYLNDERIRSLEREIRRLPDACRECGLNKVCRGGDVFGQSETRYSLANQFRNKSIYCNIYMHIYLKILSYLVAHGLPWIKVKQSLGYAN